MNKIIKLDFDNIESCEVKHCKLELDCTRIIEVQKGKITFKNGINDLITFIKRDKNVINITKIEKNQKL